MPSWRRERSLRVLKRELLTRAVRRARERDLHKESKTILTAAPETEDLEGEVARAARRTRETERKAQEIARTAETELTPETEETRVTERTLETEGTPAIGGILEIGGTPGTDVTLETGATQETETEEGTEVADDRGAHPHATRVRITFMTFQASSSFS